MIVWIELTAQALACGGFFCDTCSGGAGSRRSPGRPAVPVEGPPGLAVARRGTLHTPHQEGTSTR